MSFKSFNSFSLMADFFSKSVGACLRMQRRVNRLHTSLTKGSVKRPEPDR